MRQLNQLIAAAVFCTVGAGTAYGWGAIAVDDVEGDDPNDIGYGIVTGSPTTAEAVNTAFGLCKTKGNVGCEIVLTFQKCGAYAASKTMFGTAAAATLKAAQERALALCGEKDCQIVISDCE